MTGMEVQCSAYFSIWFQQDGLNQTIKTSLPFMSYINLSADVILSQLSPEDIKTMLINCADKTMFSHSCDSSIRFFQVALDFFFFFSHTTKTPKSHPAHI